MLIPLILGVFGHGSGRQEYLRDGGVQLAATATAAPGNGRIARGWHGGARGPGADAGRRRGPAAGGGPAARRPRQGRLDLDEYDERLQQAYAAKTYGDLDGLARRSAPVRCRWPTPVAAGPGGPAPQWLGHVWGAWFARRPIVNAGLGGYLARQASAVLLAVLGGRPWGSCWWSRIRAGWPAGRRATGPPSSTAVSTAGPPGAARQGDRPRRAAGEPPRSSVGSSCGGDRARRSAGGKPEKMTSNGACRLWRAPTHPTPGNGDLGLVSMPGRAYTGQLRAASTPACLQRFEDEREPRLVRACPVG